MSTDRKIFITQDAEPKTRNLELGGGLESGDGGGCVIGIEELEEQVSAKGGRTLRSTARSSKGLWKIRSQQAHVILPQQI